MSGRLLVRLPNPIGDVVAATPLLQWLRIQAPHRERVVAGSAPAIELLDGAGLFERSLPIERSRGLRAEAAALRRSDAEVVLLLPNSWSSALAAWRAGIPRRIGRGRVGRGLLLHVRFEPVLRPRPMDRVYLELAAALGHPVPGDEERPATRLRVGDSDRARADRRLEAAGLACGSCFAVAPGAAFGPSKILPLPTLADCIAQVTRETGWAPLLLGAPSEAALLADLDERLRSLGVEVRIGAHREAVGLGEMKALVGRCRVILSADSGARHVAAALGVPQVVAFGPTHPQWSAFRTEALTALQRPEVSCLGCHKKTCPIDHRCLRRIPAEELAFAVIEAGHAEREGAPAP